MLNQYTLSNSSSCNSLSAIANTLKDSSSSTTLNFMDNTSGKIGNTQGGLKSSLSTSSSFPTLSSMVTGSIETATKIPFSGKGEEEEKGKLDMESSTRSIPKGDAKDKTTGKSNDTNSLGNDDGNKSIGSTVSNDVLKTLSSENGNVSLATSIFDEDRTSIGSFYDKDSISTDNGFNFYNCSNPFTRGRSFSICADSFFIDPLSNSSEYDGESLVDTFDIFGGNTNDFGPMKSMSSFPFPYYNSSRRQSCPLISSFSEYSLSKKKSLDDLSSGFNSSNLGRMPLDSLDEMNESKPLDRARKGSSATLNDFTTGNSSALFKEDSFLSSLNYSINSNASTGSSLSFANKKASEVDLNNLLSSKAPLTLSSEGLNDTNSLATTLSAASSSTSFLNSTGNTNPKNATGSSSGGAGDKIDYPYRKTRSYSTSSVVFPFAAYPSYFTTDSENQESLSTLGSTAKSKAVSSTSNKVDKSFSTKVGSGSVSEIKNPWLSNENKSKSSSNLFKLNTFTENHDYDFGFNLGWKTDKKLPSSKLNTDLYNISEGQASTVNDLSAKTLSTMKGASTTATTGNNSNSSLNTMTNSTSNDMLYTKMSSNFEDKSSEGHSKTKKKLLGWGFLAKYNFIDFDDDAYQEDKKPNPSNPTLMKNRQNNAMPYGTNSNYTLYNNNSMNPSLMNTNPYLTQTNYNGGPGYNGGMINKMGYMNSSNVKGGNSGVMYTGKNGGNNATNTISYPQKNGMVYYNNDGSSVPISNNYNVNGNTSGTGPTSGTGSNKNHPVYHPNSKKANAKMLSGGGYNYYQNPGMVSRNLYNENAPMNNGNTRYSKYGYKNGNANGGGSSMNPVNKVLSANGKNGDAANTNALNDPKGMAYANANVNANGNGSSSGTKNTGGSKKKVNKNGNPNNNANINNPNNSASALHDPNAKMTANPKAATTTKSKKKNKNNAAKNKNNNANANANNNNNSTAEVNATIDANIATILNSISNPNTNASSSSSSSSSKGKKGNPNNKNGGNTNNNNKNNVNSNDTGKMNDTSNDGNNIGSTSSILSEQPTFNLNIAEFVPSSKTNTTNNNSSNSNSSNSSNTNNGSNSSNNNEKNSGKKVSGGGNEKNKEIEKTDSSQSKSAKMNTNSSNEFYNSNFHPAKTTTSVVPIIETGFYNKEN